MGDERVPEHRISITLIEPHEVARRGIEMMLLSLKGVVLTGSFRSVSDAVPNLSISKPHIVGVESSIAHELLDAAFARASWRMIVLIRGLDPGELSKAAATPADGYLVEVSLDSETLEQTIFETVAGKLPTPTPLTEFLLDSARGRELHTKSKSVLTTRELEVLRFLSEGLANKEIARRLGVSGNCVKRHVSNILAKLNCQNRTEAVVKSMDRGWLSLPHR